MSIQNLKSLVPLTPRVAAQWTKQWREKPEAISLDLKGFTVEREEVEELFKLLPESKTIRFYLAYNSDSGEGTVGYHLVFCGVDDNGDDVICPKHGEYTVFDLTRPCPTECGTESCLNSDVACGCEEGS